MTDMPEVYPIGTNVELLSIPYELKISAALTVGNTYKVMGYNGGSLKYLIRDDEGHAVAIYRGRVKKTG
jgi:hypothetical protein